MEVFMICQIVFDIAVIAAIVYFYKRDKIQRSFNASCLSEEGNLRDLYDDLHQDTTVCDDEYRESIKALEEAAEKLAERVKDLEGGLVPNYEEAKKATEEVNGLVSGINGLFSYDPYEALEKERKQQEGK